MRKLAVGLLVLVMVLVLAGCGQKAPSNSAQNPAEQPAKKKLKVALLLPGPVNDMGWNASAYEGLKKVEKDFNVEVAYTENVAQSDMEEIFRGYATQGYELIFGHGFQFGDAAKKVAEAFPNVKFVVTSSNISQPPNLASVNIDNEQQGFLMGVVAGLMTKSGTVGAIGGQEIPPIVGSVEGFKKGVAYANPKVKVLATYTGNFNDVAKTKETALAMIADRADVLMANANQAGLGSIEAAKEKGVFAIGSNQDQNSVAPNTVLVSGIKSVPVLISFVVDRYLKGQFEPKFYNLGFKEGAVYLSPWHGFEDKVPKEVKNKIKQITDDLANGKINVSQFGR